VIEVQHLTKRYGSHTAVSDLSFTVEKGQIYGFLGPNGAGKSTTMNIMTGCLAASEGSVTIDGYDIFEQPREAKRRIGYLPEQPPLYPESTPREYLQFAAEARGVPKGQQKQQIEEAMELTGITQVGDRLIRNLSKGFRQRVGIAQALLGDPAVIILDEPTVGLDPKQIVEIRELIQRLGQQHTVILSSHILSEVQAVCTTILILSHGRLAACDTPENLTRLFASAVVEVLAEAGETEVRALLDSIPDLPPAELSEEGENRCCIRFSTEEERADELCRSLFQAFSRGGTTLLRMNVERASLEDVFLELTEREVEEA